MKYTQVGFYNTFRSASVVEQMTATPKYLSSPIVWLNIFSSITASGCSIIKSWCLEANWFKNVKKSVTFIFGLNVPFKYKRIISERIYYFLTFVNSPSLVGSIKIKKIVSWRVCPQLKSFTIEYNLIIFVHN